MEIKDEREALINELCVKLAPKWGEIDMQQLKNTLYMVLNPYEITSRSTEIAVVDENQNKELLKQFIIAMKVSGRTVRTLQQYKETIGRSLQMIGKTATEIRTEDIRMYIAIRMSRDQLSVCTISNEIRYLKSFFQWMQMEEIIYQNPMLKIEKIKGPKIRKEALTDMEVEKLRKAVRDEREQVILEVLLSTGCRVAELVQIQKSDIQGERILVHGKGQKDRFVYLNAKAMLAIENYLAKRNDKNLYLLPKGHRLTDTKKVNSTSSPRDYRWWEDAKLITDGSMGAGSVEGIMRKLASRAGVAKANPHKLRRTCATMALRRGMPIEQVSKMLGHEELTTTQIYLDLSEDELAQAHKKYVI